MKAKASPGSRVCGKQSFGGRLLKTLHKTKDREDKKQVKKEARVSGQFAKCMSTYKDTKARLLEDWFDTETFPDNEEDINVDWLNLVLSFVLHASSKVTGRTTVSRTSSASSFSCEPSF